MITTAKLVKTLERPEIAPDWRLIADLEKEPEVG
jgi:hypothetical protein